MSERKMYQLPIHPIIHRMIAVYRLSGMWENEDDSVSRKVGKKLFYIFLMLSFVAATVIGACFTNNKNESIFLTTLAVLFTVALVRLTFVLRRKREISAFSDEIGVHTFTDQQEFVEMKKKLTNFAYISYSLFILFTIGIALAPISCLPVFSSEKRLPFNIAFPLNWKNSEIVYWIAFTYVECGILITVLSMLNNLLVWYLMINYSIKYKMLGNKLKNLGKRKAAIETSQISLVQKRNLFLQDFIKLVKIHRCTQKTVQGFRDCFSKLFFAQITTSAITICGMIYVLAFSSHENLMETVIFGLALIYSLLDIFTLMYFANEIKLSSSQLPYCLFQSNWIDQSESCKKCIIILTEVLIKPQKLVTFKMYPLDLETFTSILKLAYSLFNILQHFN